MSREKKQVLQEVSNAMIDTIGISNASWKNHLAFSSKFYKYSFANILLLQAHNPNFTACADYKTWNSIGRRINAGEKGIQVYGTDGSLTHVFDITQTNSPNTPPKLWEFKDYHLKQVRDILVEDYGEVSNESDYVDLKASIENHVAAACLAYLDDENQFLKGSELETISKERLKSVFIATMQDSVGYMVSSRLGIPQGAYNNDTTSFQFLKHFTTPKSIFLLGNAVKNIGSSVLRKIEREVKNIDKQRSMTYDNGRNQETIRQHNNDDRRNISESRNTDHTNRQIRQDGDSLHEGEPPAGTREPSDGRELLRPLYEPQQESQQPQGTDNDRTEKTDPRTENEQLHGDGEVQYMAGLDSGGTGAQRDSLQVNNESEGLTDEVSPFFVSKDGLYRYKVGDTVLWENSEKVTIGVIEPDDYFGVQLYHPNSATMHSALPINAFEKVLAKLDGNEHLKVEQEENIETAETTFYNFDENLYLEKIVDSFREPSPRVKDLVKVLATEDSIVYYRAMEDFINKALDKNFILSDHRAFFDVYLNDSSYQRNFNQTVINAIHKNIQAKEQTAPIDFRTARFDYPNPFPITQKEWDDKGKDYKSYHLDGTPKSMLINDHGATCSTPVIIDNENGFETKKYLFEDGILTHSVLAYHELEAMEIAHSCNHMQVKNLRVAEPEQEKNLPINSPDSIDLIDTNTPEENFYNLDNPRPTFTDFGDDADYRLRKLFEGNGGFVSNLNEPFTHKPIPSHTPQINDYTVGDIFYIKSDTPLRLYEYNSYTSNVALVPLESTDIHHVYDKLEFERLVAENPLNNGQLSLSNFSDFTTLPPKPVFQKEEKNLSNSPTEIVKKYNLAIGGIVHLEQDTTFEIDAIRDNAFSLRDRSIGYPIFRSISAEEFENLYLSNPLNAVTTQQEEEKADVVSATNFKIEEDTILAEGGTKTKYKNNIAALTLLKNLEGENRPATSQEQEVLAKYVGWGGMPQVFDEEHSAWKNEYVELKELLSEDEYGSAMASVLNAHYTSKDVIGGIYKGLQRLGYTGGGNLLEPALGVGHFFGTIPEHMTPDNLYGVELDSVSGRIAKKLYPNANIQIQGFEKTMFPDNFIDIAVGNVPFGNYKLADPQYNKHNLMIHDYFFAKTLDKVRPDGVIAFITSKGTLDKKNDYTRRLLAEKADFLGAIRLPNTTFKSNAGTEVTTDIIFLQKKSDITKTSGQSWINTELLPNSDISVNEYFANNPHMMLGTMEKGVSLYGNENETALISDGRDLKEAIEEAVSFLPVNVYSWELKADIETGKQKEIPANPFVKNYGYTIVNNEIYQRENSVMILRDDIVGIPRERVIGLVALKEQVDHVIELQVESCPDEILQREQGILNSLYDSFVKKYGYINSRGNSLAFRDDSDYPLLCSLEMPTEDEKVFTKADMFHKRTIQPYHDITHCDTSSEALAVSLNLKGYIDLEYMSELTGVQPQQIIKDLEGIIFKNPEYDTLDNDLVGWESADEYLSGNVVEKLEIAIESAETDDRYAINVAMLEQVQPVPLEAHEISVKLGASWIDSEIIKQFIVETLKPSAYEAERLNVYYATYDGTWMIANKPSVNEQDVEAYSIYGTSRMNGYHMVDKLLNQSTVSVYDTVKNDKGNDSRVLNKPETIAAREKAEQLQGAFKAWIFNDPERRNHLVEKYNAIYNSERLREYDGSHLTFPHMSPTFELRPHQKNAVARAIYGGNTLLYHCVGAGKTATMAAIAMKMKQLGITQKPIFVVPNHIIDQWAGEFMRIYPSANLLITTENDFQKSNRQRFISRIATGNYDGIIIGHSQFEKIPMSPDVQRSILSSEIKQIKKAITEQKLESGGGNRSIIKALMSAQMRLEERYEKLMANDKKDDQIVFENLGVDSLFVDESHNYKNLHFYTKMRDVAGIPQTAAQKSTDMFLKTRYINQQNHGHKGVIFASGTAISNAMTEMFTLQKYMQHDTLEKKGIGAFDSWAGDYGTTMTTLELAPSGKGLKQRRRFAKFDNLPELMNMFHEFADVQTADMLNLPVPKCEFIVDQAEQSAELQDIVNGLVERSEKISGGGVDPSTDNMLKVTHEGRLAALDIRLIDPTLPDHPDSKINMTVNDVFDVWQDTAPDKLTQMIFCDISTPVYGEQPTAFQVKKELLNNGFEEENADDILFTLIEDGYRENQFNDPDVRNVLNKIFDGIDKKEIRKFDVYNDIKDKLIHKGIPENEVAFIHDCKTNKQKEKLFEQVRKGEIRVLLGSTHKMGAGTNVQDKLVELHHIDVPWRPSDVEQREGRILRQGNDNESVRIHRRITKGSFDAYSWQIIENKQRFISQVFSGKSVPRTMEEIDNKTFTFAEIKAMATGDPRILRKSEIDVEVNRLEVLQATYNANRYRMEDNVLKNIPRNITATKELLEGSKKDLVLSEKYQGDFSIEIKGKSFDNRVDGGKYLLEELEKSPLNDNVILGNYKGFSIFAYASTNSFAEGAKKYTLNLKGTLTYPFEMSSDPVGIITRLENASKRVPDNILQYDEELKKLDKQLEATKIELTKPFEHAETLASLKAEQAQLNAELTIDTTPEILIDEEELENDNVSEESYENADNYDLEDEQDMER